MLYQVTTTTAMIYEKKSSLQKTRDLYRYLWGLYEARKLLADRREIKIWMGNNRNKEQPIPTGERLTIWSSKIQT